MASDIGLHGLHIHHKKDARLLWIIEMSSSWVNEECCCLDIPRHLFKRCYSSSILLEIIHANEDKLGICCFLKTCRVCVGVTREANSVSFI